MMSLKYKRATNNKIQMMSLNRKAMKKLLVVKDR